jgi:hypothetical protein
MQRQFHKWVNEFKAEGAVDFIGLWQLVHRVIENGAEGEADVRATVVDLMRELLAVGFKVGDMSSGRHLNLWRDQRIEAVAKRVQKEWIELGHMPTIGDICWFEYRPDDRV